jgi:hypothetical protein
MAITTPNGTTPPNNRRTGAVFYNANGTNFVRSTAVPLQPITFTQAVQRQILMNIGQAWGRLPPDNKALWTPGINSVVSYSYYSLLASLDLTWGYGLFNDPPPLYNDACPPLQPWAYCPGDGTFQVQLSAYDRPAWPYIEIWWSVYVQVSNLVPALWSGLSDTPVKGAKTASGYVYVGEVGPFTPLTLYTFDWTDLVISLYGKLPLPLTDTADPDQQLASILAMQIYTHDENGIPVYADATSPTPPTPPTVTLAYSASAVVGHSGEPTLIRAPADTLTGPTARWRPNPRHYPALNRSRASRGLPTLTGENLRRGFPAIAASAIVRS